MTEPRQLTEADLDILKRIERVPFGRFQWRLLWMGGLGYTFDAMDGAMIAITTIVLVIGALAVGLLGIATAGKSLEQIAAEARGPTDTR